MMATKINIWNVYVKKLFNRITNKNAGNNGMKNPTLRKGKLLRRTRNPSPLIITHTLYYNVHIR
jgi:hypothetical protein